VALRLGTENKKQVITASVLGVVLLGVLIYEITAGNLFGGSSAPPPPAQPVAASQPRTTASPTAAIRAASAAPNGSAAVKVAPATANIDPTLHPELMAQTESLEYTGKGRNIFSQSSVPVEIPQPVKTARNEEPAGPVGPPPPPAIDLKFFGYLAKTGTNREALLLHGEDVFIAKEGEVVDRRYRVEKIASTNIQITDLPYNNTQTLPLIQN
jgi:hypothetical protein